LGYREVSGEFRIEGGRNGLTAARETVPRNASQIIVALSSARDYIDAEVGEL
jgi:hypothetical protein